MSSVSMKHNVEIRDFCERAVPLRMADCVQYIQINFLLNIIYALTLPEMSCSYRV